MENLFVTYNKNAEIEENTALRLQTLSNLYGFSVLLPYRLNSLNISTETKTRINNSKFVLAFCIEYFSPSLKQELDYALTVNKPIVVIYDQSEGKKINFPNNSNVKEVYIDYDNTDATLHEVSKFIKSKFSEIQKNEADKNGSAIGIAIVALGLGLLAAWALSEKE